MNLHAIGADAVTHRRGVLHAIDATPAPWRTTSRRWPWSPRPISTQAPGRWQDIGLELVDSRTVFLTDSDDEIRRKIMTHASGGGRRDGQVATGARSRFGHRRRLPVAAVLPRRRRGTGDDWQELHGSGQGPYCNTAAREGPHKSSSCRARARAQGPAGRADGFGRGTPEWLYTNVGGARGKYGGKLMRVRSANGGEKRATDRRD